MMFFIVVAIIAIGLLVMMYVRLADRYDVLEQKHLQAEKLCKALRKELNQYKYGTIKPIGNPMHWNDRLERWEEEEYDRS